MVKTDIVSRQEFESVLREIRDERRPRDYGKVLGKFVDLALFPLRTSVLLSGLIYGVMSFAYGPYDAGKVIYAELSGDIDNCVDCVT